MTEQTTEQLKQYLTKNKYLLNTKANTMSYKISYKEYIQILQIIFEDKRYDEDIEEISKEIDEDYQHIVGMNIEIGFTKINIKKSKSSYSLKIDR